ncbi:MAG: SemiSWEET transporter [Candidatus Daviesbacteria bacterium]|nr:SemiSWEET transporter [Candidatus Daviesbacteria bacterium]
MTIAEIIGFAATILAPLSFLSQVIKTWKSKETKDISLGMYVIFWIGVVLWLTYGLLLKDRPIVINNIIMLTLTSIMLFFKLRYK